MQSLRLVLLLATGACRAAGEETSNPLAKVIELMDDFAAKVTKEGEEHDLAYREYVEWCDDAAFDFRAEIKTATAKKGKLEADIEELTSQISTCDANIEKLVKALATADKDLTDATVIREKEAKEFATSEAELMDTIDTLKRAIAIISKEMAKNPAFAQVDTSNFQAVVQALGAITDAASFSSAGKQRLMALVQANQGSNEDEDQEPGAPAAKVYESHSGDLVEMLEDLLEKAEEDLADLRKAETNAKQNYEMLKQSLEDTIKNGDTDKADEEAAKKAASEEKATSEKDLAITVKNLKESESQLENTKTTCMQVAADHEQSVAGRAEELKVIAEAKKILQETTGGAVEQSYSLIQLQSRADLKKAEVLSAVKTLAKRYHSSALAQLASRIEAAVKLGSAGGADPFEKVKGMISDLIAKLEKEASDAAEEKAYCDDQMAKTEEKKNELEEDLAKLTAKMDKDAATSAGLKEDVKVLQEELAALAKLQSEMDKIRADENEAYKKSKADMEKGLDGVGKALTILKDYYQGGASLLQSGGSMEAAMAQPAPPAMHSKGMGAGGGIIGILEVCESDFAKSLASIEQEESDAVALYEETTQENAVTKTKKEQAVKYKTQEFKSLDKALADMATEKETMSTELKAVLEYYAKIKDRCIAKPEGYEERKRRREAEIAGLKEALSILESETALVEVRSHHRLGHHFTLKA